ncbi:site-specific recombinase xerd [Halobacteriales archaeon SW_8_68_21]|nr:MAG: site-specific recombinase xerd [Halobacteriales archaeon SW_8_68_21]
MMDTEAVIAEFQDRQMAKKAESTATGYTNTVKKWTEWLANPGVKDYDVNRRDRDTKTIYDATTGDLRVFLRQQLKAGMADGTVRNRRWAITSFYKELEKIAGEGYDLPNFESPAKDLDMSDWFDSNGTSKKAEKLKEDIYYLEPEEIDQLAENAPNPKLRNELIIRLLYQTGMRRGELSETRLTDVYSDERKIKVYASKTDDERNVYYQPSLDTLMNRWINVERKALSTAGSEYLFPTYKTEQIKPKQINRTVRKAADNAGIQESVYTNAEGKEQMKVTAHVLRHSFAVQSVKNDMNIRFLQELMGHAKIETTRRYLRVADSDVKDAARKYGAGTE